MGKISKADQVKFGIWTKMKEYGFLPGEIAVYTGYDIDEISEFFKR